MRKTAIIILTLSSMLFTACEKWLDIDLKDQVIEEDLFSTRQGYNEALAGVYSMMGKSSLYGQALTFETLDIFAQVYEYETMDAKYEMYRDLDYKDMGVQRRIDGIWKDMYRQISALNNIIRWLDINGEDVLTKADRNQIRGEAIAIRAYLHFDLLRMFAPDVKRDSKSDGIPYNKQFGVSLPPMYSVEEVVALVLNDLSQAASLLENDPIKDVVPYELAFSSNEDEADLYTARMNYYSVRALMARVYLAKGDKAKARQAAEDVIYSEKFRLVDFRTAVDVEAGFVDYIFSDEHIFSLRNREIIDYSQGVHSSFVTAEGSSGPAKLAMPSYQSGIYNNNNDDIRLDRWFAGNHMDKFNNEETENHFFPKVPLIKLSEMYLIAAESWLNIDNAKCMDYINQLRSSRIRIYTPLSFMTKEGILAEYRRDFMGEGQIFFTYKRMNSPILRESGRGDISPSNEVFVFPIPMDEIENGFRN